MMTGIHVDAYKSLRPLLALAASPSVELFEPSIRHVVLEDESRCRTMEVASWLMGMDSFLMDLALEEGKALRLMERVAEAKIEGFFPPSAP